MKRHIAISAALFAATLLSAPASAADYAIDTSHASIQFRIQHLGFSWLSGRFDKFDGNFSFDEADPAASKVAVTIDTTSINTNHAERDKHLRSGDFLDVAKNPEASFVSTSVLVGGSGTGKITGELTLNGVTREITLDVSHVGGGKDPWGGFRQGFTGTTILTLADFGYGFDLGPASQTVEMTLDVEGIRQ